jgi:hypothetical protein
MRISNRPASQEIEMKNKRIAVLMLLTSVMLASCMTSDIMMIPAASDDQQLAGGNEGILLLQVADTTPFGRWYPANQLTVAPKDVNEEEANKFPRLEAAEGHEGSTQFFYSTLPANEYSLKSIRAFKLLGDAWFSKFYPAGIDLGTFTIEPGKVTDLGVLVIYIKRSGEDYYFDTIRVPSEGRTAEVFKSAAPGLAAAFPNLDDPLTWHSDANDADRDAEYSAAVNRQIVYGDAFVDQSAGLLMFPSRLGVYVKRDVNGLWALDAVPEDVELRQVTRVGGADVVVTEFNEIFRRADGELEWERVEAPVGAGELMYIGYHETAGVIAVRQSDNSVSVWMTPELGGTWTNAGSFIPELGFFASLDQNLLGIDQDIEGASYVLFGDDLLLALRKDLYRFNVHQKTFTEIKLPKADSVQVRNGFITVRHSSTNSAGRVSFDGGQTWAKTQGYFVDERDGAEKKTSRRASSELPKAKLQGHPIFIDKQLGFAINKKGNRKDDTALLISTTNGAQTWVARPEFAPLPEGCGQLILATNEELLLSCFLSGEFYRSVDGGKNWQIDRSVSET